MANNDPWLGVEWKVYAVQGPGGSELKPANREGVFTLSAVKNPDTGQTASYTVDFADGDMPACWQGIVLYPRGSVAFSPPAPLLQPWTPNGDGPWLDAADAVRKGLNDSMARLISVLNPDTNAAMLTLVCVPKATTVGTPLLVMKLQGVAPSGAIQPMDISGGGHGDN